MGTLIPEPTAGEGLLHPVALAAVGGLLLNDHVWKYAFPGLITGKLSDAAGLVFFPLFLQAGIEVVQQLGGRPWEPSRRVLWGAVLATGIVFASVQVVPAAADVYQMGLGALQWPVRALLSGGAVPFAPVSCTPDPTDLFTLPLLVVPLLLRRGGLRTLERGSSVRSRSRAS